MCVALLGRERPQASAGDPPAGGGVLCGAQGVFGMGETLASTLVGLVRRIGLSSRWLGSLSGPRVWRTSDNPTPLS